jgi:hypothetical protein
MSVYCKNVNIWDIVILGRKNNMFTIWEAAHILKEVYLEMVKEILKEEDKDENKQD